MKEWKKLITDGPVMTVLSFLVLSFATLVFFLWDTIVLSMRVRGRKNLRPLRRTGFVVISNHSLFLEPAFISHAIVPRHPYFSIMEQTFVNPVAEWGLRLLRGFPIPRRKGIERIEPEIARVLKHGGSVHFFPEGYLTHFNQEPHPFKKGAFLTAIENQVPILPVATVIHHRKFRGKVIWNYLFRLTLVISEPMTPPPCPESREDSLKAAGEMAHKAHKIISDSINEWGS
ncbi:MULTISPECIES: lysophospholipid acyltransferase family protein [unclassified Oceanispirochaeta]|uniref:lysophospholipid acyltransferase family protein n=1 Tax=unclassified Oceanispirochaeta TaxID=2635722 RepID=UPI000E093955|nr:MULTISPECIES: lysophospholipid acyltransferase family protein [unclassified Oceanispirochaeta]MBF9014078.1 1-acyl-sn-glycerol-3-phosphate acyltransferase [Oceanispirochaeta sp. M2]NPD70569.1 1-acyl-sn-glycerol-3-phosphate acyltransferase [Oceanispirochaeta sp. M1]RDG34336.1 1-acyl-sn-glycerol-3-phosphate acyltransferase [Oceanispirochaeta sp. M1]